MPHSLPRLATIDGQPLNMPTLSSAVAAMIDTLAQGAGFTAFTLNLDHLVKRRANPAFLAAYRDATFVTADGAPIVALARRQGARLERTTGADLVEPLCKAAADKGLPVYFFGTSAATLDLAGARLKQRFPGLTVAGASAPAQGFDPASQAAADAGAQIAHSGARLCFLALGAPKQELFAARLARIYPGVGFVCIGASLDFIAGTQMRAPRFFQNSGLEWFWRLATNPRRLTLRYAQCALLLAKISIPALLRRNASAPQANSGAS